MNLPQTPSRILNIAVIGTGTRAQSHLQTIQTLTDLYRLTAVCDPMPGRAEEVGGRLGVPGYTDLSTMFDQEKLDAVLVTAPPEFHHTVACEAAARGVHVLCETPIAVALPYADAMIQAAKDNGVVLEIAENVWRFPQERFKKMLLDSGMLGDVRVVKLYYTSGSYHGINAVRQLVPSEPTRVVGMARIMDAPSQFRFIDPYHFHTFGPEGQAPPPHLGVSTSASWEAGLIEFADGAVVSYEFPMTGPWGGWHLQTTKGWMTHNEVVLVGDPNRRFRIVTETEGEGDEQVLTSVRLYEGDQPLSDVVWENPFLRYKPKGADDVARIDQLVSLYRAITEGIEPEYGAEEGRKDMEVLIAVRESARRRGEPVDLPITEVTGYEERLLAQYGEPGQ